MKFKKTLPLVLIFFVACKNGVKDKSQSTNKISFDRSKIELVGVEVKASDSRWPNLKDIGVFSFQTCLTDNAYMNPVAGEKFVISTENYTITKTTNAQGCLTWLEKVKFNYLEDERFILLKGSIRSAGNYKGGKDFSLAINPWRETVVDQDFGRVQVEAAQDIQSFEANDKISIPPVTLTIISHQFLNNETIIELDVVLKPHLMRKNLNGGVIKEPFTAGLFNINFYLLSKNSTTNQRRILAVEKMQEQVESDGRINSRISFKINQKVDAKEMIELAVKLQGHESPIDLGVSEGVISFKQLTGSITSELIEIPEGLDEISSNKNLVSTNSGLRDEESFGFIIDTINISSGAEIGDNLSSSSEKRSVEAVIKTCLVDSLVKEVVKDAAFNVELKDEAGQTIFRQKSQTELRSGCLNVRAQIPYKRFDTQKWRKYNLIVTGLQEPFSGVSKKRLVYINPWIRTSDFGIDSEVGTAPLVSETRSPKLFIQTLNYNFLGNSQSNIRLNKAMDLSFNRSYMIELQPKIMVDNRFEGESSGLESVMSGKFKLRVLILTPKSNTDIDFASEIDLKDYYTLTGDEKVVSAEAGAVRAKVDLPLIFSDLIPFSFKNIILVEISSADKASSLRPGYFVGIINGLLKRDSLGMTLESRKELSSKNLEISRSLLSRLNEVDTKLVSDKFLPSTKKYFMKTLVSQLQGETPAINPKTGSIEKTKNLVYIYSSEDEFKNAFKLNLSSAELSSLIDNPNRTNSRIVNEICHAFYDRRTVMGNNLPSISLLKNLIVGDEHKRCIGAFKEHINLQNFQHVENIVSQPKALLTQGGAFTRNSTTYIMSTENFFKGIGEGRGEGTTHSLGFNIGASVNKIIAVGGGYSYSSSSKHEFFVNKSTELNLNLGTRADVAESQRYLYDKFIVNFQAKVTKCLLMTPKLVDLNKDDEYSKKKTKLVSSPRRIYFCKSIPSTESLSESYYMVKNMETGIMADTDVSGSQFISFIRGQKLFQNFQQKIQDTSLDLVIVKIRDDGIKAKYDSYIKNEAKTDYKNRFDGSVPGLIDL